MFPLNTPPVCPTVSSSFNPHSPHTSVSYIALRRLFFKLAETLPLNPRFLSFFIPNVKMNELSLPQARCSPKWQVWSCQFSFSAAFPDFRQCSYVCGLHRESLNTGSQSNMFLLLLHAGMQEQHYIISFWQSSWFCTSNSLFSMFLLKRMILKKTPLKDKWSKLDKC